MDQYVSFYSDGNLKLKQFEVMLDFAAISTFSPRQLSFAFN